MNRFLSLVLLFACSLTSSAKVQLPQLFQSGMVVQRGCSIPVWGQADSGERVVVSFRKKSYEAYADANGHWRLELPQQKAGGPYRMAVNDVVLDSVFVGDVWLCSGQSNIDVTVERVYPQYTHVIDDYANDHIRLLRVLTDTDTHGPKSDIKQTSWRALNRDNAWTFSAIGYFLGREMFRRTGVPQGIIVNSLGGSPIQAWLAADTIRNHFPADYQRLVYYQDDDVVRALQTANQQASNRWQRQMDEYDPGLLQGYAQPDFDDHAWREVRQYDNLTGRPQYVGSFWARQQVDIDAAHAGRPARLLLGTLFDMDYTYLNGREVGRTYYQYPPRRYDIPAGVLREGANTLAVRFVTKGGNPHFIKEKPYKLVFDDGSELPLSDRWRVSEGAPMPRCPQADISVQNLPSVLYNAMLCPLAPYPLAGVVWYQGESNTGDGAIYEQMLTQLITGWRQLWQAPEMPFVVVQLANFMEPSAQPQESGWSLVREAQRLAANHVPQTALAVTIDLGETVDIHPLRKREVAERVALAFDHLKWNPRTQLSPEVTSATADGAVVTLTLDQALAQEGEFYEFEVAGADGRFVNAQASGSGRSLRLTSGVSQPRRVRYAWKNNPIKANVYGLNGLPMSPFQMEVGK